MTAQPITTEKPETSNRIRGQVNQDANFRWLGQRSSFVYQPICCPAQHVLDSTHDIIKGPVLVWAPARSMK
ncbi:MAG: hypothetical protein BAA01_00955 [Bacillus thermozeamaize]|uniref:Uncharacterized protein n=1 Tax=Bacillus thermozeamaize TaxID=230954 RepID=A0A1Y3PAS6_9BACI|nr:MAG: hypothetical protein BAA01_00955 [Bacillus thermozeamaize]